MGIDCPAITYAVINLTKSTPHAHYYFCTVACGATPAQGGLSLTITNSEIARAIPDPTPTAQQFAQGEPKALLG